MNKNSSKVIKEEPFHQEKWLGIKLLDYTIGQKVVQSYETAYRTTTKKGGIAGVNVVPIIKYQQKPSQLVLIANFRPACNSFVLEFPAGLVEDENYAENAKRELEQETGLVVDKFLEVPIPINYCDPWKSDESGIMFIGTINGDDPNSIRQQNLQSEENIRVHYLQLNKNLSENLAKLAKEKGYAIESKVSCLINGFLFRGVL